MPLTQSAGQSVNKMTPFQACSFIHPRVRSAAERPRSAAAALLRLSVTKPAQWPRSAATPWLGDRRVASAEAHFAAGWFGASLGGTLFVPN
jgi:hypothetical protein